MTKRRYILNPKTGDLEELNPRSILYAAREIIAIPPKGFLGPPGDAGNFGIRLMEPGMNIVNGRALRGERAPAVPPGTIFYPDAGGKGKRGG